MSCSNCRFWKRFEYPEPLTEKDFKVEIRECLAAKKDLFEMGNTDISSGYLGGNVYTGKNFHCDNFRINLEKNNEI